MVGVVARSAVGVTKVVVGCVVYDAYASRAMGIVVGTYDGLDAGVGFVTDDGSYYGTYVDADDGSYVGVEGSYIEKEVGTVDGKVLGFWDGITIFAVAGATLLTDACTPRWLIMQHV